MEKGLEAVLSFIPNHSSLFKFPVCLLFVVLLLETHFSTLLQQENTNQLLKKENRKQKRRETYLEQQITNEHRKTSHAVRLMSCQRCARYDKQQQQKNNKKPKIGDAWRAQFK